MTPEQQRVYDAYPMLANQLIQAAAAMIRLPLDDMLVAVDRVIFNGTVAGVSHGSEVDVPKARNQRQLIEAAISYRDAVKAIGDQKIVVPSS